jgi:hypothetical protein
MFLAMTVATTRAAPAKRYHGSFGACATEGRDLAMDPPARTREGQGQVVPQTAEHSWQRTQADRALAAPTPAGCAWLQPLEQVASPPQASKQLRSETQSKLSWQVLSLAAQGPFIAQSWQLAQLALAPQLAPTAVVEVLVAAAPPAPVAPPAAPPAPALPVPTPPPTPPVALDAVALEPPPSGPSPT